MRRLLIALTILLACTGRVEAQAEPSTTSDASTKQAPPYYFGRFRVDAQLGWAYRLGKNGGRTSEEKDYIGKLRSGYQIGANLAYHVKPNWGLGLHYQFVYSNYNDASIRERVYTNFLGPSFHVRTASLGANNRWAVFSTVSIGYLLYVDEGVVLKQGTSHSFDLSGETVGYYFDGGFELRLFGKLYLLGGASLLGGSIRVEDSYVSRYNLPDNLLNTSNIGLFTGLRIGL